LTAAQDSRIIHAEVGRGSLLGIPPTGRQVVSGVMVIARFDERGKWVEDWASWHQLGMLQQLGAHSGVADA
jgi:predicted ester cyclase